MRKCLKRLLKEENGAITSTEYLLFAASLLGVCYTLYIIISNPIKELHVRTVENLTSI